MNRRALSPEEFAEATGIGRTTVYKGIRRGEIRSVKLMGRRLIPVEELDRLLSPVDN